MLMMLQNEHWEAAPSVTQRALAALLSPSYPAARPGKLKEDLRSLPADSEWASALGPLAECKLAGAHSGHVLLFLPGHSRGAGGGARFVMGKKAGLWEPVREQAQ